MPRRHKQTPTKAEEVLHTWYDLGLELVWHTPTYSPPVASRSFAYLGVTAFEAVATGSDELQTLAGQLHGLKPVPQREAGKTYDEAVVLQAAMAFAVQHFFENTGPSGQNAMTKLEAKLREKVSAGVPADVLARSEAHGRAVAEHILAWSQDDGGAVIETLGFPQDYELTKGTLPLGAHQPGCAPAKTAFAELGKEPDFRHAGRHELRLAVPS